MLTNVVAGSVLACTPTTLGVGANYSGQPTVSHATSGVETIDIHERT